MLLLGVAILSGVIAGLCFARYGYLKKNGQNTDWDGGGMGFTGSAVVFTLIGFLSSAIAWSSQISDFEDIKKFKGVEIIYRAKANALTEEFARYLAKTYPEHEKEIYDKISPDKVDWYFAKYPELRASETLVTLVERINQLQSDVYDQRIKVEETQKDIRFRLRNPWLLTFMIPEE